MNFSLPKTKNNSNSSKPIHLNPLVRIENQFTFLNTTARMIALLEKIIVYCCSIAMRKMIEILFNVKEEL